jgi:hypothetical protein
MRFSEWLGRRMGESSNPEMGKLKDQEREILNKMGFLKDPAGRLMGFNAHTFRQLSEKLKEVRARIKELEGYDAPSSGEVKPIPAWIQGRKAV